MWPPGSQCLVMADQLSVLCLGWMIGSLNINNPVIPPSIIHQGSSFSSSSSDIVTPGSCVLSIFLSANKSILQTIGRNFSIVVNQSGYYSGKNISSVRGLCPDPGGCQCCHPLPDRTGAEQWEWEWGEYARYTPPSPAEIIFKLRLHRRTGSGGGKVVRVLLSGAAIAGEIFFPSHFHYISSTWPSDGIRFLQHNICLNFGYATSCE